MNDLVSIIVPLYNAERYIESTIQSVLRQTYKSWELLLIDDCSNDNSYEIIKKYLNIEKRIRYFKLQYNGGAAVARNYGINIANGRYIAFLDSDDCWLEHKLAKEIALMNDNHCAFVYTAIQMINEKNEKLGNYISVPCKVNYNLLLKNTVIATSTVLIDKDIIGNFSMPNRRSGQDYATWLMLLRKVDYAYGINEPLCLYRKTSNSLSSNKLKSIKQVFDIQTKNEGISKMKAIYNTICFCFYAFKKHFIN